VVMVSSSCWHVSGAWSQRVNVLGFVVSRSIAVWMLRVPGWRWFRCLAYLVAAFMVCVVTWWRCSMGASRGFVGVVGCRVPGFPVGFGVAASSRSMLHSLGTCFSSFFSCWAAA
jgi:hypothetical protein